MIEVFVESIRVNMTNYRRVVMLKEKTGQRFLPIWIGHFEADAIAIPMQNVPVTRPLTHDLLGSVISSLGGNVVGARVFTSRQGQALDVFYVQDVTGAPLGCENPRALRRLADALEAAARGETATFEPRRGAEQARAAAFAIAPAVTVDNEASDEATVVEASGRDRPTPPWIQGYLVPTLGWVYLGLVVVALLGVFLRK